MTNFDSASSRLIDTPHEVEFTLSEAPGFASLTLQSCFGIGMLVADAVRLKPGPDWLWNLKSVGEKSITKPELEFA
jgi:hypothetical protein